jgi:hypothetical protein
MTLQGFSFGSAAEIDAEAKEKDHSGEVGFGLGDGDDVVAAQAGVEAGWLESKVVAADHGIAKKPVLNVHGSHESGGDFEMFHQSEPE